MRISRERRGRRWDRKGIYHLPCLGTDLVSDLHFLVAAAGAVFELYRCEAVDRRRDHVRTRSVELNRNNGIGRVIAGVAAEGPNARRQFHVGLGRPSAGR